ncbi:MAG: M6 family metalloprotease domain-containing protein [Deltaproteobacteria bacterium]|nr:M6 family metalloprotease domain-containing protein [Deltaproteobacteria bacterium]MBW2008496.1 M6 family metalloprotease domain-containing protein [Deltaproteobacteria bacterium]MBW2101387.1 M6 family metalloprotease domain-containing protein [Deltaproteobacteria bacterium]RLB32357.1 MAG: hypothetical protein DRH20_14900 [Deltaproteobacteria bacterium]
MIQDEGDLTGEGGGLPSGGGEGSDDFVPPADDTEGLPTTGNPKIFALLINFADYPHTIPRSVIDEMLFGDGNPDDYPRESLKNYYLRSSYGLLDLSGGTTFAWYQTPYPRSDVLQTRQGRQDLIREVLEYLDGQGHDFSQYDNDNDGDIDYFVVFWTGPNTGWGSFWWAYETSWREETGAPYTIDGKTPGVYSWQWEADFPKVVIHETGHALGLPDYYDYNPYIGPGGGVGGFDMMHSNTGDHNCFSKWLLGWIEPQVVSEGVHTITLGDTTTTDCVLVWPGIGLDDMFSEFFLVQNRQDTGNDESLNFAPDGLAVWHVDATLDAEGTGFAYDNSYTTHKLLKLMEADGLEEIESTGQADAGDLYPERKQLRIRPLERHTHLHHRRMPGVDRTGCHGSRNLRGSWRRLYRELDFGSRRPRVLDTGVHDPRLHKSHHRDLYDDRNIHDLQPPGRGVYGNHLLLQGQGPERLYHRRLVRYGGYGGPGDGTACRTNTLVACRRLNRSTHGTHLGVERGPWSR